MALDPEEMSRLLDDFRSGRNPLAFIPLCTALRRHRRFGEALDHCQAGLAQQPQSSAGRAMLVRLLCDLGRYDEAMREADNSIERGVESVGLKAERVRCMVKLRFIEEAAVAVDLLNRENPMDPYVQAVTAEFRQLERATRDSPVGRRTGSDIPATPVAKSFDFAADTIHKQLMGFAPLKSLGLFDLDSGRKKAWDEDDVVDAAEEVFQETALACLDLDAGLVSQLVIEMASATVMIVQKSRLVAVATFDQKVNQGKLHHRMNFVMEQIVN